MFRLGCAVWAYKGWLGELYPEGASSRHFLELYGEKLSCVEGNTTFYATPDPQTLDSWAAAVGESFHFCPKLPKGCTHDGPLSPHIGTSVDFARQMTRLGERLGPIFAQLPPTYSPRRLTDLAELLRAWPHADCPLAVEVRHPDWFVDPYPRRLNRLLASMNVGRVLLDTRPIYDGDDDPQIDNPRKKPEIPLQPVVTAHFAFVRYIGHPDLDRNEVYLEEWAARIESWLEQDIDVYFFAHCPTEDHSPKIARRLYELLRERKVAVAPIDWALPPAPDDRQMKLF